MKFVFVLIATSLLSLGAFGADPQLYLKSAPMPFYPALGRSARIQGKVTLHFTVDEKGNTSEVEATTGNEVLRNPALENVQNWKFWPPQCACRVKREAVLVYMLSAELGSAEKPDVVVKWFTRAQIIRVEVEGDGGIQIEPQNVR
jgi:TonB family protein